MKKLVLPISHNSPKWFRPYEKACSHSNCRSKFSRYQKAIVNAGQIAQFVDRLYVYDNSIDNQDAHLIFRSIDGKLAKQYTDSIPEWAETIKNKLK